MKRRGFRFVLYEEPRAVGTRRASTRFVASGTLDRSDLVRPQIKAEGVVVSELYLPLVLNGRHRGLSLRISLLHRHFVSSCLISKAESWTGSRVEEPFDQVGVRL